MYNMTYFIERINQIFNILKNGLKMLEEMNQWYMYTFGC